MRCPKCNANTYSHHQEIYKSGTAIKRYYACRKCKYVFETIEQIIENVEASKVSNKGEKMPMFKEKLYVTRDEYDTINEGREIVILVTANNKRPIYASVRITTLNHPKTNRIIKNDVIEKLQIHSPSKDIKAIFDGEED